MQGPPVPECVVPRHQAGEGEDRCVSRDLLLPQGTFNLLPVPRHHLVIVSALWEAQGERGMATYFMFKAFHWCLTCLSCETLTAAVYDRRAGWQGDLLELRRNYGNRRLVYPWLCQVENKKLTRLLSPTFVTEALWKVSGCFGISL